MKLPPHGTPASSSLKDTIAEITSVASRSSTPHGSSRVKRWLNAQAPMSEQGLTAAQFPPVATIITGEKRAGCQDGRPPATPITPERQRRSMEMPPSTPASRCSTPASRSSTPFSRSTTTSHISRSPNRAQRRLRPWYGRKTCVDGMVNHNPYLVAEDSPGPCSSVSGSDLDAIKPKSSSARILTERKPDIWFPFKHHLQVPGPDKYWTESKESSGGMTIIQADSHDNYMRQITEASTGPGPLYFPKLRSNSPAVSIGRAKAHDVDEFFGSRRYEPGPASATLSAMGDLGKAMDFLNPRSPSPKIFQSGIGARGSRAVPSASPAPGDYDPQIPKAASSSVIFSSSPLNRGVVPSPGTGKSKRFESALEDQTRFKVCIRPNERNPSRTPKVYSIPRTPKS